MLEVIAPETIYLLPGGCSIGSYLIERLRQGSIKSKHGNPCISELSSPISVNSRYHEVEYLAI